MSPRRVLIVRMSHLGDIAQTLTLVHAVRRFAPDAVLGAGDATLETLRQVGYLGRKEAK